MLIGPQGPYACKISDRVGLFRCIFKLRKYLIVKMIFHFSGVAWFFGEQAGMNMAKTRNMRRSK